MTEPAKRPPNDSEWQWYAKLPKERLPLMVTKNERVMATVNSWIGKDLKYDIEAFVTDGKDYGDWSKLKNSSLNKVLNFVSSKIKYQPRDIGKAYTPTETLALRQGVCLEYANLVVSLLRNIGYPKNIVNVAIGYKKGAIQDLWHAYVIIGRKNIEPQVGNLPKFGQAHHNELCGYVRVWQYNDESFYQFEDATEEEVAGAFRYISQAHTV